MQQITHVIFCKLLCGGFILGESESVYNCVFLACVTEQTHDIRVYGLCDGARFAVP